jgi:hypothetical protein
MNILQEAKNIVSGKGFNDSVNPGSDNRIDRIDQAKVVWYQWANPLLDSGSKGFAQQIKGALPTNPYILRLSNAYDISNHIASISYSKDMNSAAGSFSIILHNSFDWARFVRPGEWITIYLGSDGSLDLPQENSGTSRTKDEIALNAYENSLVNKKQIPTNFGSAIASGVSSLLPLPLPTLPLPNVDSSSLDGKKLRVMGVISRVGIRSAVTSEGALEITYVITGRDFGTVYEETEIWFNANNADNSTAQSVINATTTEFQRNVTDLLDKWHDLFLNPKKVLSNFANLSAFYPEQWLIPTQLADDLDLSFPITATGYFGEIANVKEFGATVVENPDPSPLSGLEGKAWDRLKSLSQPEFHELFTELSDSGRPKLFFRPIPWALDTTNYPIFGSSMLKYRDLTSVDPVLPPVPIGTNLSSLGSIAAAAVSTFADSFSSDQRLFHAVPLQSIECLTFDVGPDYHNRYNFFLINSSKGTQDQTNAFSTISALSTARGYSFPVRNENNIKRNGFKPMILSVATFLANSGGLFNIGKFFTGSPAEEFILEANYMMEDLHGNDQDFYSGTITIYGRNDVKLGKVIVTDDSFQGIGNMVFYIEGYEDVFTVNGDGTTTWTQNLNVTRGMTTAFLNGGSPIYRPGIQTNTFHSFDKNGNNGSQNSLISAAKKFLKSPLG